MKLVMTIAAVSLTFTISVAQAASPSGSEFTLVSKDGPVTSADLCTQLEVNAGIPAEDCGTHQPATLAMIKFAQDG